MAKKNIVKKIANDLAESTRAVHEINKENIAAVHADTVANFNAATAPHPGLVKVKQAKGVKGKAKAIIDNIVDGAKENTQKEKARLAEIQSHGSYKTLLDEQRVNRQRAIKHS
jgi:hypothetical protein